MEICPLFLFCNSVEKEIHEKWPQFSSPQATIFNSLSFLLGFPQYFTMVIIYDFFSDAYYCNTRIISSELWIYNETYWQVSWPVPLMSILGVTYISSSAPFFIYFLIPEIYGGKHYVDAVLIFLFEFTPLYLFRFKGLKKNITNHFHSRVCTLS